MQSQYIKCHDGNIEKFGKVAVLCGGFSAERDISLMSGRAIYQTLQAHLPELSIVELGEDFVDSLSGKNIDTALIALHGVGGEDGKLQALLDLKGIAYTGSRHDASALAMNKLNTKLVWKSLGLPTPTFEVLADDSAWEEVLERLGGSVMVKPVHEGSSIGIAQASSAEELAQAYKAARKYDPIVIAETFIRGPEFSVSILHNQALPSIRMAAKSGFYDYQAKYFADDTEYHCPSGLSDEKENEIRFLALKAFKSLACSGWGRVDFMQNRSGDFFLLEANTVPGMTGHSLVPMAAKVSGLSFEELIVEILETSAQ